MDLWCPAAVPMSPEGVGAPPTAAGGERSYRERIAELVRARRAYARFINGQVVFKAELAVVTRHTAQIQGVWTSPEWRGRRPAPAGPAPARPAALRPGAPPPQPSVN